MSNYSSSSADKISYNTIIAQAHIKSSAIENNVSSKNSGTKYPNFKPDTVKDLTDKEFAIKLLSVKKTSVAGKTKGSMVPLVLAAKSLKLPDSRGAWKLTLPNARHRPDVVMYARLLGAGLNQYAVRATEYYRSNGTKIGLLKRLSEKLIADGPVTSIRIKNLSMKPNHVFETDLTVDSQILQSLNKNAAAGLPYALYHNNNQIPKVTDMTNLPDVYHTSGDTITTLLETPIPIIQHALNVARRMINDIPREASSIKETVQLAEQYFTNFPDLNTFILKRKDERLEREDFYNKVRPYGAQPLPTRLVSMWAVKPLEDMLANFIENPNSISAYHYSHFYGGSMKIIEYFETKHLSDKIFSGLAYGDDQLWMVKLLSGKVVMLAPDVSAMDMSTNNSCISDIIKFVHANSPIPFPPINLRALYLSLILAFKHDVHIGGPFIISKIHSLISGIPGTTIINIFNSARIQTVICETFEQEKENTESNFFRVLGKALNNVKNLLGYKFKGLETLSFDALQKDESKESFDYFLSKFSDQIIYRDIEELRLSGIPLPFLSQVIRPVTVGERTAMISVPKDLSKFGCTLVLPSDFKTNQVDKTLARVAGVYISGGWTDPDFGKFLRSQYKSISNNLKIVFSATDTPVSGELDILSIVEMMTKTELPSEEFMLDFNSMDKDSFMRKYKDNPTDIFTPDDEIPTKTLNASTSRRVPLDSDDVEELDKVLGFNTGKSVKISKMGHSNANDLAKEQQKLDRLKRLKTRRALELDILKIVKSKKNRDNFSSMFDQAHDDDLSIDERNDVYDQIYQEMSEYFEDLGEGGEELNSLMEAHNDFYASWDRYTEDDGVEEVEKDDMDDLDEYISSDRGLMEFGKGNMDG